VAKIGKNDVTTLTSICIAVYNRWPVIHWQDVPAL